jgi:formamidopyrimidine-DNA glycosylase
MPELPDLQVFSSNLDKALKGKTVEKVSVPVKQKLNVSVATLTKKLKGQRIKHVYRDGKELHISFGDNVLALHLMLHGNLYLFEDKNDHRHTVLSLHFSDHTGLALTDWQRAATPTLNPAEREAPDALSKDVNGKRLKEMLQRKTAIKALLLDQKIIRGIGNAYADEILWDARIAPTSVSNKIPDAKVKALARSIKKVLTQAEKQIRKANPAIITGEIRDFLSIHNAKKKESPTGAAIRHSTAGGRKTYYTDEQEVFK